MSVLRDGPLEITGGGVTIPPSPPPKKKIHAKETCLKKNPANGDTLKKKNIAEEATSIAFKVTKSMG